MLIQWTWSCYHTVWCCFHTDVSFTEIFSKSSRWHWLSYVMVLLLSSSYHHWDTGAFNNAADSSVSTDAVGCKEQVTSRGAWLAVEGLLPPLLPSAEALEDGWLEWFWVSSTNWNDNWDWLFSIVRLISMERLSTSIHTYWNVHATAITTIYYLY